MKEFQLTRYLRRWWWIVALVSALIGILFYLYTASRQTYRAQIMIEFTNDQAEEGLYPTGKPIDVQEIRSSVVISNALEAIGQTRSVDSVRSCISIAESITEEEAAIQTAKWTSGETYDAFPTRYIVSYVSLRGESATSAQRTLEAVIDSYIRLYSEKYVSVTKVPNSVESLQNLNYDYLEWAEVIDDYVKQDRDYLMSMKGQSPSFRSSATGYSFQDLYNEYNLIHTVYLPSLYAEILNHHVSVNPELLTDRLENRIARNNLDIESCEEAIELVEEMIENYTDKNRDTMDYHWKSESEDAENADGSAPGNQYVVGTVYDFEGRERYKPEETTYDSVIDRYVALRAEISDRTLDNQYCRYILDAFRNAPASSGQEDEDAVKSLIAQIEEKLRGLDGILTATAAEHSEVETIRNVRVCSTVYASETTNIKLYTLLIAAVFFLIGVVCVVIVGRGLDFVDYHFYTDPVTDLPNRVSCDREIARYSQRPLRFPFTCAIVALANMNEINESIGREGGNELLRIFANYLRDCAENYGFAGYNGGLQFLCLFPECDEARATYFSNLFARVIGEFNREGHGVQIRYQLVTVVAKEDSPRSLREMLSEATASLRDAPTIRAEEEKTDHA